MANHKNRKPKSYKGHCTLCSLRTTNGKRNGRQRSVSELKAAQAESYYWGQEYSYEEHDTSWDDYCWADCHWAKYKEKKMSEMDRREKLIYDLRHALDILCNVVEMDDSPRHTWAYEHSKSLLANTPEWEFSEEAVFSRENQKRREEYRKPKKV